MIPRPRQALPEPRSLGQAAEPPELDRSTVLNMPVFKGEPLGAWLLAYLFVHETLCSEETPSVHRLGTDVAELTFDGFGGVIIVTVYIETADDGYPTGFDLLHLSATTSAGKLEALRFDSDEAANPLLGLTHALFHLVEMKAGAVLEVLREASLSIDGQGDG